MRHAILIDSYRQEVRIVALKSDNDLGEAYSHIGCSIIEAARRFDNGDAIYVDEEGAIVPKGHGSFWHDGREFKGRGLIVGEANADGPWTAPLTPIAHLMDSIQFRAPGETAPALPSEPTFGSRDILSRLGAFHVMEGHDFEAYAGAAEGSVMCGDFDSWEVIIAPGNAGDLDTEALSVHAYRTGNGGESVCFKLTVEGWEEL